MSALAPKTFYRLAEIIGNDHYSFRHHDDFRSRARRLQHILTGLDPATMAPEELLCEAAEVFIDHCRAPEVVRAGWARYAGHTRDLLDGPDEFLSIIQWQRAAEVFRDAGLFDEALTTAETVLHRFQLGGDVLHVHAARSDLAQAAHLAGQCRRAQRLARAVMYDRTYRHLYHHDGVRASLTTLIGCGHDRQAADIITEYVNEPKHENTLTGIGAYLARYYLEHAAVCTFPGPGISKPLMRRLTAEPYAGTIYQPPPVTPINKATPDRPRPRVASRQTKATSTTSAASHPLFETGLDPAVVHVAAEANRESHAC